MNLPSVKTSFVEATNQLDNPPCRIFFKNELEQPSGSFKLRGIGYLVATRIQEAKELGKNKIIVFSSSGGNAGLAAAFAARYYDVKCTVVLPEATKRGVVEKLGGLGAKTILHGAHWGEADAYLRDVVIKSIKDDEYAVYCHPFDDPVVWKGHSQIINEILEEQQLLNFDKVKGVVCSVGGGGLYNGIVEGVRPYGIPVLAMETAQAPTFNETIKADKIIHLKTVKTIASSLGSPYLAANSFENYKTHPTYLGLVDDLDAVQGTIDLYDRFNYIVEPACGASVATVFRKKDLLLKFGNLKPDDIVIIIVCGGAGINEEIMESYRELTSSQKED
ncbi:Cha1 protein [Candida orthopsilosis Co 90-125]|uniref:L-serine ammonia-lyase n=1 Tax=Candida orthopsilosis (strain 90-125) TaxID=1136231 RepID=H8X6M8_CANO9|nr:Cha1 protein [Candida orthopsilosis Co 90-125]CCG23639.1 Cha1 protein [Candida orthopsilosis Co 90-125]